MEDEQSLRHTRWEYKHHDHVVVWIAIILDDRVYEEEERDTHKELTGQQFWDRGNYVSTVGLDEEMVGAY